MTVALSKSIVFDNGHARLAFDCGRATRFDHDSGKSMFFVVQVIKWFGKRKWVFDGEGSCQAEFRRSGNYPYENPWPC